MHNLYIIKIALSNLNHSPIFSSTAYIIKKLGNILTFLMVLVVFSIRHLLYSAVVNPWYFLPVSLLHGLSFSVFYPNMMSYASSMAPKGVQAMMQGTVKSFFIGGKHWLILSSRIEWRHFHFWWYIFEKQPMIYLFQKLIKMQ